MLRWTSILSNNSREGWDVQCPMVGIEERCGLSVEGSQEGRGDSNGYSGHVLTFDVRLGRGLLIDPPPTVCLSPV